MCGRFTHILDPPYEGGTTSTCKHEYKWVEKLSRTTKLFRSRGEKAYLGELGAGDINKALDHPKNSVCYNAVKATANYMAANNDVWIGYAWWTAGSAWRDHYMNSGYMYDMTPILDGSPSGDGVDSPPMVIMEPFL